MTSTVRRVVTGLDEAGRSTVLFDDRGPIGPEHNRLLWFTLNVPADNSGREDTAASGFDLAMMRGPGSCFLLAEIPPSEELYGPAMHASDTIDYLIVLRGRMELTLETGKVELDTGDCVIDRGVPHGWRALDGKPTLVALITLPAEPVGAGGLCERRLHLVHPAAGEASAMSATFRRVVTGLDEAGRSAVLFDDTVATEGNNLIWWTPNVPADNGGRDDAAMCGFDLEMMRGPGSSFVLVEIPPSDDLFGPGMHASNTVDYIVVLRGRLELTLETGKVELATGDFLVDRGIQHGWRALEGKPGLMALVTLPAGPIGAGGNL